MHAQSIYPLSRFVFTPVFLFNRARGSCANLPFVAASPLTWLHGATCLQVAEFLQTNPQINRLGPRDHRGQLLLPG